MVLPPSSPDLCSHQITFATLRTLLCKADGRSVIVFGRRIRLLLPQSGAAGCAYNVRHADYDPPYAPLL